MRADIIYDTAHLHSRFDHMFHHKLYCREIEAQKMWAQRRDVHAHGNVIICESVTASLRQIASSADSYICMTTNVFAMMSGESI